MKIICWMVLSSGCSFDSMLLNVLLINRMDDVELFRLYVIFGGVRWILMGLRVLLVYGMV